MASFREVIDQVLELTGRPDKQPLAKSQINLTIRRIVGTGNLPQNLYEVKEEGPFTEAVNSFVLPERFQAVSYVRMAGAGVASGGFVDGQDVRARGVRASGKLEAIDPKNVVDADSAFGYYVSGGSLLTRAWQTPETLLIGWYRYPPKLEADTDTNWVLDRFEAQIVDLASAHILGIIGDVASRNLLQQYGAGFLEQEVRSALSPYQAGA